jgi:peptidoglycan hydrolase-like protein with peptidoglycan-binding domain
MKRLLIATSIVALATASAALAQNNPASSPTTTTSPTLTGGPNTGGRYQTGEGAGGDLNSGPDKTSAARSMNAPHQSMSSMATNGKHAVSRVRQAQIALKQKGLYDGPIDGKEGPKTRTAITQFQKQNGLQQSAQLNRRTLNALETGGSSSSTPTPSAAPAAGSQQ